MRKRLVQSSGFMLCLFGAQTRSERALCSPGRCKLRAVDIPGWMRGIRIETQTRLLIKAFRFVPRYLEDCQFLLFKSSGELRLFVRGAAGKTAGCSGDSGFNLSKLLWLHISRHLKGANCVSSFPLTAVRRSASASAVGWGAQWLRWPREQERSRLLSHLL